MTDRFHEGIDRGATPNVKFEMLERAVAFAKNAHQGQFCADKTPYIDHVYRVARQIFAIYNGAGKEAMIAVLHDVLEKSDATFAQLAENFGLGVASGVETLTKYKTDPTFSEQDYLRQIVESGEHSLRIIKLADKIDNLRILRGCDDARRVSSYVEQTKRVFLPVFWSYKVNNPDLYYEMLVDLEVVLNGFFEY